MRIPEYCFFRFYFNQYYFDSISHRLKQSWVDKLVRKFNQRESITVKEILFDPSADRVVRKDKQTALQDEVYLHTKPTMSYGDQHFKIKDIYLKNYFEKPKDGFEGLVNNAIITYGANDYPIEIQLQIKDNYYRYELSDSPADLKCRKNYSQTKKSPAGSVTSENRQLDDLTRYLLYRVFGNPITKFDIRELRIVEQTYNAL